MSSPKSKVRPQIFLKFEDISDGTDLKDVGLACIKFEFKGMVNGGYIIRAVLQDPYHDLLHTLVENGYFEKARDDPIKVIFQIKSGVDGEYPETATYKQSAIVCSLHGDGQGYFDSKLEFVAIDPPSWYLNTGDAFGGVYKGNVSKVIKQVVEKYGTNDIKVDITKTIDSEQNQFWQMRQDPKTFIGSLIDWSSRVTPQQTQWIINPHGMDNTLTIKEQAELNSTPRAYYRYRKGGQDHVHSWEILADNALSLTNTEIITAGLSAISGSTWDMITDKGEKYVYVKDDTTSSKQIAKVDKTESYAKPPDAWTSTSGFTAITGIPEIYSAGDIGVQYQEYIDGRARAFYLNMVNMLFRIRLRVQGHGEWSSCNGLGIDTIYIKWVDVKGKDYFLGGNWLIYGFHHHMDTGSWYTDLYCARFDYNANARKVGGGEQ